MNSRPIDSDDHELPPSAARVSASSRFSRPPAAALYAGHDFGTNDNYRAASPASSRASAKSATSMSKSGINGRTNEDEEELGLSGRSARRSSGAAVTTALLSKERDVQKDYRLERTRSSSSTGSSLSNSGRDRPWRTAARTTSSSSGYVTANANYEEEDALSTGGNDDGDAVNTSYDVEVTSERWSQYETKDLAEESRQATCIAVVDMATKIADRQAVEEPTIDISSPMGGSVGAGLYQNDPNDLEGLEALGDREGIDALETNGNSLAAPDGAFNFRSSDVDASVQGGSSSKSTTDYVKSRLSAIVTHRNSVSQSEYERQLSTTSTKSDHDRVRDEALKMLQIADSCLQEPSRSGSLSPRNSLSSPTAGLFRTAGGGLSMRELHDDEASKIQVSGISSQETLKDKKRKGISSIAGLEKFRSERNPSSPGRAFDGTFTIGSHDEEDLQKSNFNGAPLSPGSDAPGKWSSRYSVERQLMAITGGLDSTRMLNKMDVLHSSREKTKSARGLYRASGYAMDGSHEEYNDYTKTSSTGVGLGGVWMWLRGTLWSDDPELNYDGTTQSLVRREIAMRRRKRFRWAAGFLMAFMVAVGVLAHLGNRSLNAAAVTVGEGDVDFYVLADEPFDFSDTEQLTRELEALGPRDAEFVVHLGNANGDEQSQCQEYGFERAASVLRESPVPVLVIPGDKDWAACGGKRKAERSLKWWEVNLGKFVEHWDHPLKVDYSDDVVGNFAFLYKDVLFISVSMVDVDTAPEEVNERLEKNVGWTKKKLRQFGEDGYRVLVIFGHAPPSDKQDAYFDPVVAEVKDSGKPVLYLHANSNGSFEKYSPFDEAENFRAVQLEKQGREAPMRVVVMGDGKDGDDTFVFERRDPTRERVEK